MLWLMDLDGANSYAVPHAAGGNVSKATPYYGYKIDLLHNGYDGDISMEPHLATVFHQSPGPYTAAISRTTGAWKG
jgi:hypothetical protein